MNITNSNVYRTNSSQRLIPIHCSLVDGPKMHVLFCFALFLDGGRKPTQTRGEH